MQKEALPAFIDTAPRLRSGIAAGDEELINDACKVITACSGTLACSGKVHLPTCPSAHACLTV